MRNVQESRECLEGKPRSPLGLGYPYLKIHDDQAMIFFRHFCLVWELFMEKLVIYATFIGWNMYKICIINMYKHVF